MKRIHLLIFLLAMGVFSIACSTGKQAASALSEAEVKEMLDAQNYRFNARYVQPAGGRSRIITGTYTLDVTKDKVEADLPYFGRAYQAPIGSGDVGMKFKTTEFNYSTEKGKRESIKIIIKPKDASANDIQDIYLTVFPNGSADLRIVSVSRQAISYIGELSTIPIVK
ncbi:DUF4251 domain-containing protein [Flavihumibacter sp. ZG627]|uniref:DUF4251 domain-containing protein n=1 Tax=Flavihumibacter sp. ZG627 TaxID=1463156 RepID=UPI0006933753|nr:DUF4251 domain-containing protein [Flavihumibacter sp. ZG627]